jgi:anti-sigma B factor antagonist
MAKLSIQIELSGDAPILKVSGRVDSETAPDLDDALGKLQREGHKNIVLDLQGVDFLSSAGLRAIVKAYQAAGRSGGDVRLASISKPVEVVLRTVGFMQTLKTYPSSQEAVASFSA